MKRKVIILGSVFFLLTISAMFVQSNNVWAEAERTVGLIHRDVRAYDGYNLFKTLPGNTFNLTDMAGNLVHSWNFADAIEVEGPTRGAHYLLKNGHLLFGENRLKVHEADWDGNILWTFYRDQYRAHHDWYKMHNGNILMIAWETKTRDEAIAYGRDPEATSFLGDGWTAEELWPDAILEWDPHWDEIVWEWHSWDHVIQDFDATKPNYGDPGKHPELIDLNYFYTSLAGGADWQHFNAIHYNKKLDQIAISVPVFNEIWIIDHSTTTAEAAGHSGGRYGKGGDLLYRWGNPAAYRAGTEDDMQLGFQHDVQWIPWGYPGAGNLLIFNNGSYREYSSVVEIKTPIKRHKGYKWHHVHGAYKRRPGKPFGPKKPKWEYVAPVPEDFFSSFISGCARLPNGNTVINEGDDGTFFEVTPKKQIVWKYINPVARPFGPAASEIALEQGELRENNATHRMHRYDPHFPGLAGKDMLPGDPIEEYPVSVIVDINPNSCSKKMKGHTVKVAILGTVDFDVNTIYPESILMEGFEPVDWEIKDVGTPTNKGDECECNDDGLDGYEDLYLEFSIKDIKQVFNKKLIKQVLKGYPHGDLLQMRLTGYSEFGWFLGKDCVFCR